MFNFSAYNFLAKLSPRVWRKPRMLAWLSVLAVGLQWVIDKLSELVDKTRYDLRYDSRLIYFELALNNAFDPNGEIYIEVVFRDPVYIYNKIEVRPPLYVRNKIEGGDPVYLRNNIENLTGTNYIVHVPEEYEPLLDEITALIEFYNAAGMVYEINFYTP